MASRATKLFLLVLSLGHAQYIYQQYIPQRPVQMQQVQQPQLVYYPMRTNCANRCAPQARYRLTYRPLVPMQPQPLQPGQPIIPINPVGPPHPSQIIRPTQPQLPQPLRPVQPVQPPVVQPPTGMPVVVPPNTLQPAPTAPSSTLSPITTPHSRPTTTTELPTPGPESTTPTTRAAPTTTASTVAPTTTSTTTTTAAPVVEEEEEPVEIQTIRPSPRAVTPRTTTTTERATEAPEEQEQDRATEPSTTSESATGEYPPNQMRPGRRLPSGEQTTFWKISSPNPCESGEPLKNDFGAPISCNVLVEANGGCPESHFCHPGVGFATTQCCPRTTELPRCDQPRNVGIGREMSARWYYDVTTKECRRFLYKGIKGNENNFITKTACMDACARVEKKSFPEPRNPCRSGDFARNETTKRKIDCGFAGGDGCPAGFYCHIGIDAETSACCESSGITDSCLLAINLGEGKEQIKRFYFNTLKKKCTEFVYKGTKGNENNFLTLKQCEHECKKWNDPCPLAIGELSVRPQCTLDGGECGDGEWCHVGHSSVTTVCCPGAVDPCEQSLEVGEGPHNLTRWYADPDDKACSRKCKQFQYGGTKGNQNNFLTKAMCENTCSKQCSDPCGSGSLLMLPTGEPRQCSPLSPCPNTHWCHVGVTPQTTVCCSAVPDTCHLPLALGHGTSHLTRWRFDADKKKCVSFFYSGEGGNQNMFLTAEDCATVCPTFFNPCSSGKPIMIGSEPKVCSSSDKCPSTHYCHFGSDESDQFCCPKNGDPCEQSLQEGNGDATLERYFFDSDARRCEKFVYRGSKGNANNFLTKTACEKACPVLSNPCKNGEPLLGEDKEPVICGGEQGCKPGYFCHVGASPDTTYCCPGTRRACDQPMESGEGEAKLERFFFDGAVQMCRAFTYKGLKGNANNFLSMAACREACREANPCGTGEPFTDGEGERLLCTGGQKHDSCPGGFFCHVGSNALTTLCCPKSNSDPCTQPRSEGAGGEKLPRFFFNTRTGRCTSFLYGGTGGNENNFISSATCQSACPVHRDYCPHGMPMTDIEDRLETCAVDRPCPEGFLCHVNSEHNVSVCCRDPTDFCTAPRDAGPCDRMETRYGYDPTTDSCVPYEYGGCGGSLNLFSTLHKCTQICCKEYARRRRSIY
ncbi:hypothetical protein PRIPAC_72190 [Pristionchus pacificus]|uniref:Uncharacterized protein n=1 Tax=Pristionchus pacificus TaxID=54126 RepID=A0A2A6BG70_PRIPA|nr:hypothetical protein PRIPAC_72190 [Pristionchus pacificus]|eukprot:PDM64915.1 hypothetical protein PRIPAC_53171 [Pristionchus pacificus]